MDNGYSTVYRSEKWEAALLRDYDAALKNWPVPFEELEIKTPAAKTHILLCGNPDGPPLLFFHGTGNNSLMWRYNAEGLGGKFRLYFIDTPNDPGKSAAGPAFKPPEGYTQWMRELLDALKLEKVSLAGHSKGGWLALNTVIRMPEKIDKVALLAPAAGLISRLNPEFIKKSMKVGLFPNEKNVTEFLQYMSGGDSAVNAGYASYMVRLIKGTKARPVRHRAFTDSELRAIKKPVLLLFGEHERSLDFRMVIARAEANVKNLMSVTVSGVGHALQGEKPDEVNQLIIDFV
ncbi:MAG: alpha/beta hydrolase [Clostridiales bacterium]|nr:alpha/beta hydrolase [Clostridiales bacterium]